MQKKSWNFFTNHKFSEQVKIYTTSILRKWVTGQVPKTDTLLGQGSVYKCHIIFFKYLFIEIFHSYHNNYLQEKFSNK